MRKLRLSKVKCHTHDDRAVRRIKMEVGVGGKGVPWAQAVRMSIVCREFKDLKPI